MNYTAYIRKDNWEYFEQEEKKSELLNSLLAAHYGNEATLPIRADARDSHTSSDVKRSVNYSAPLQRACCKLPKPCQHWVYDGTSETWTNILDGEVKGV